MELISGVVQEVSIKNSPDKAKPWTMFGVKVNDEWYSTFRNNNNKEALESLTQGANVSFTFEASGKYKNIKEVKSVTAPTKEAVAAVVQATDNRQLLITQQAARRDSVELVKYLIDKEFISVKGTKKATAADSVYDYINKYTDMMVARTSNYTVPTNTNNKEEQQNDNNESSE